MKKGIFSIFLVFAGLLFLFPLQARALDQLKTCTYGDDSSFVAVTMYNDYTIEAKLTKLNGKKQAKVLTTNWTQLVDYIRSTTDAKCPTYAVLAADLNELNFSNNKKSATTLSTKTTGTIFNLNKETFTENKKGLAEEAVACRYQFKSTSGKTVNLAYKVFANGRVGLPFSDNSDYLGNGKVWYHADDFANKFYNSSQIDTKTYTCPSLLVQENELGVTVYPNGNGKCSGRCSTVSAKSVTVSESAQKKGITTKKVIASCTGSSVGLYKSKSYFFPYFRLYSDGTKEWSIDGENFTSVTNNIKGSVNKKSLELTANASLIDDIFQNGSVSCPTKIYRCVNKKGDGYSYELSTSATACSKDELGSSDGQGYGSSYASGAFGDPSGDSDDSNRDQLTLDDLKSDLEYGQPNDCNSILGSVGDDESVAWLLQQILNYLKVLGPILVVILSSIDFSKAIVISDDDNMKKAQKKLIVRLIAAVALFLVPTLVQVLLDLFGITSDASCVLK